VAELKRRGILIDGSDQNGILLQIFTKNAIGPIFLSSKLSSARANDGFR